MDPAPTAPELVERAVRRLQFPIEDQKPDEFEIDVEIIEDVVPPPVPTLAERKAGLINQFAQAEAEALCAVISSFLRAILRIKSKISVG